MGILESALCCPACRSRFLVKSISEEHERFSLHCENCFVDTPVLRGFPIFQYARPVSTFDAAQWLSSLETNIFVAPADYRRFLAEKSKRGSRDLYAAFQPFNESTRSIYPFLETIRERLAPGDLILDTWCRTGWSGELLAGLFPEQTVISLWEGDKSVLGVNGFDYWLSREKRRPNLEIIFTHPNDPLPLETNSIKFLHGLDTIHRYRQSNILPECLRVVADDGLLLFPHIHLSNNEPDPFFQRGCHQYHGATWREWLDHVTANSSRAGWVLPEPELFSREDSFELTDDHDTNHYNGTIFIADASLGGSPLGQTKHLKISPGYRFVRNPLLEVNVSKCSVALLQKQAEFDGAAFLDRHPCYQTHLDRVIKPTIDRTESQFIWYADQGYTLNEITQFLGVNPDEAMSIANSLSKREILHAAPVGASTVELQNFLGMGALPDHAPTVFSQIWAAAREGYGNTPVVHWLEDGSELSFEEIEYLVSGIRLALREGGGDPNEKILLSTHPHPAALLICWAVWLEGKTVVMLQPDTSVDTLSEAVSLCGSNILFTDKVAESFQKCISRVISYGREQAAEEGTVDFFEWIAAHLEHEITDTDLSPALDAVVLFTSGSTGKSKGVTLSQEALCRSGWSMASHHLWRGENLLSTGCFASMSGLRNPAVASLTSLSTVFLPARGGNIFTKWNAICEQHISVLTAVPSFMQQLFELGSERISKPSALKLIMLTGTRLDTNLKTVIKEHLDTDVVDYYGLTETGGLCFSTFNAASTENSIGMPVNAIAHVLDDAGKPVKERTPGRLFIKSNQLMSSYINDSASTQKVLNDGWLDTGDIVTWNADSSLTLIGRADDQIKLRSGNRVYPQEIESAILSVGGFTAAAVVCRPRDLSLIAFVVPEDVNPSRTICLNQALPSDKIPDNYIFLDALPLLSTGKVDKQALIKQAETL